MASYKIIFIFDFSLKNSHSKKYIPFIIKKLGVDIFSGAGGLSLGAINAGIDIVFAVEKENYAAKTYIRNHPKTRMLCEDIIGVDPLLHINTKPFIVFGGPPCQGFSVSNRQTRNIENENNGLFKEFLRFVRILEPEWFLFENVEGIVNFNKGKTLKYILSQFERLGYCTKHAVLYASDYGVPQHRNRFFIVGNKRKIDFIFPESVQKIITVGEAIGDLPILENGANYYSLPYRDSVDVSEYAKLMRQDSEYAIQNIVSKNMDYVLDRYKHIKEGENWRAIPDYLMSNYKNKNNCHSGIYKRLKWDEPSVVIANYRKNMLIHPIQDRGLSVREAARIQSFPDNFIFEGSIHYIQQQIGNAVPPLLAEAIFNKILFYNDYMD